MYLLKKIENYFHFKERKTNFRTEIIAGITTFFAMCYILFVNAGMFSEIPGVSFNAIYITTAISAVFGTVLMGLLTNLPLALAAGLGINAFFVYTCCFEFGFTYENSLLIVLIAGAVFLILTLTGLRKIIIEAIPHTVNVAISAGLGLFIVFVGLQSSKIIIADSSTLVKMCSFNVLEKTTWINTMPPLITFLTVLIIGVLVYKKNKIGVFAGIVYGTLLYYILGFTIPGFKFLNVPHVNVNQAFSEFYNISFLAVFRKGFDFSAYLSGNNHSITTLIIAFVTSTLAFCMLDMFDTIGTLYGTCRVGNLLKKDKKGNIQVPQLNRAMTADATSIVAGAIFGTSSLTTYMESCAGIGSGGRTGFSSLVVGFCFIIATFFVIFASFVPPCAYGAALIYVGVIMCGSVLDINWKDLSEAFPAFLTIVMIPYSYNITYGIGIGVIAYIFIKFFTGQKKQIGLMTYLIGVLFFCLFIFTH